MKIEASSVDNYFENIPEDRKEVMIKLRKLIQKNIPKGFKEVLNYNMPSWVVPHTVYKPGYHCDPKLPLPFLSIASQKNFIAFYHMGIYADTKLLKWFETEYPKHSKFKLDKGKSCIRFKKPEHIPFELMGELVSKMTPQDWIELYESALKK